MKNLYLLVIYYLLLVTIVSAQWFEPTIPVGDNPWDLVYDSLYKKVYCANIFGNHVTVIDKYNSVIKIISVRSSPGAFAWNPNENRT